jgi:hypothetical protein
MLLFTGGGKPKEPRFKTQSPTPRRCNGAIDQRWVAIAETHLQQSIMATVRSIAQP